MWIGPLDNHEVGEVGFLIHRLYERRNLIYKLSNLPLVTNVSKEPRLYGWCGTYNNVAYYAGGIVKVVAIARNGRVKVEELQGQERIDALEALGYPELRFEEKHE